MDKIEHPQNKVYYSMGEVCELFGVRPSLIRFWQQSFPIIKPKRNAKGNRLFRTEDVDNLALIYNLVKERGMTLEGANRYLRERRDRTDELRRRQKLIDYLQKIRNQLQQVHDSLDESNVVGRFDDSDDTVPFTGAIDTQPSPAAAPAEAPAEAQAAPVKRGRGRPKGSRNRRSASSTGAEAVPVQQSLDLFSALVDPVITEKARPVEPQQSVSEEPSAQPAEAAAAAPETQPETVGESPASLPEVQGVTVSEPVSEPQPEPKKPQEEIPVASEQADEPKEDAQDDGYLSQVFF